MGSCLDSSHNSPVSPRHRNNNPNQHPYVATAYPYQPPEQVRHLFNQVCDFGGQESSSLHSFRTSHSFRIFLLNQGMAYPNSFQRETQAYPKSADLQQHQRNDTPQGLIIPPNNVLEISSHNSFWPLKLSYTTHKTQLTYKLTQWAVTRYMAVPDMDRRTGMSKDATVYYDNDINFLLQRTFFSSTAVPVHSSSNRWLNISKLNFRRVIMGSISSSSSTVDTSNRDHIINNSRTKTATIKTDRTKIKIREEGG